MNAGQVFADTDSLGRLADANVCVFLMQAPIAAGADIVVVRHVSAETGSACSIPSLVACAPGASVGSLRAAVLRQLTDGGVCTDVRESAVASWLGVLSADGEAVTVKDDALVSVALVRARVVVVCSAPWASR